MGSRLKQNPERTFHWFFEAACPVARDKDPGVLFQFPGDFSDEESGQTLPKFCFPYDIQRKRDGVAVQHFTFVLTDLEGCQRFGFCRLANSTHTCLCILSYLPWFEVFYKLLNNLADYLTKGQTDEMTALLDALYKQPIPLAAGSFTLQMGEQLLVSTELSHPIGHPQRQEGVPYFIAPDPRSLPSIPENRNLTELIVAVDVGNLLQVYASLLFERRILIFASKLSTLTSCVHALSAVLYPMYWQHIFIPVLPPHLLDYCCAPMPYLIGVHTSLSERVRSGLEEVVILNVDTNTLETPFEDLKRIPSDVMSRLKLCLKRQAVSPGSGVSQAFLKAQALLFGGYRDALQGHKEGEICFSEELFLDHKSHSMRQFLQSAIHLQFFKQFIDGRLESLNKGKEPDDLFEDEILKCESTDGRSKSYQQLVGNLKKGGGALIVNMRSKANMRAKGLAKSGLKNLRMHKAENGEQSLQRIGSASHRRAKSDSLQNRLPITQHFGMSRPRRPVHKHRSPRDQDNMQDTKDSWDGAGSGPVVEAVSELQRDEEEGGDTLLCDLEEMDLLGEIFDTLSSRSSHDRGVLYGTRSLDLFGPDSHDYITKFGPAHPSQESLSLSISGSGSLHSWNLDTTDEPPDLTEDSDWLCPDRRGVPEEEGSESLRATWEMGKQERGEIANEEKQGEGKVTPNWNQVVEKDDSATFKGERFEDERKKEDPEIRASSGEDSVKATSEKREDEGFKENKSNQSGHVAEGQERETNTMQKDVAREGDRKGNQEGSAVTSSLNERIQLNPHEINAAEERRELQGTVDPETAAPPGPESLIAAPPPPATREKSGEEEGKKGQRELRPPPKWQAAAAHFKHQASSQSFQGKSTKVASAEPGRACNALWSKGNTQTHPPRRSDISDQNNCSGAHVDSEPSPLKVSELKKRFEV